MEGMNVLKAREIIETKANDYSDFMERKIDWERFISREAVQEDLKEAAEGYRVISRFIELVLNDAESVDYTKILELIAKRCDDEALKVENMRRT